MAKQLQLRRGTTVQNDAFTGAVGELTMDTQRKGLRIHDGSTQGGIEVPTAATADYVVEFQAPTAENNYTWYRKYRSGWVECGLQYAWSGAWTTILLPVAMRDANSYTCTAGGYRTDSSPYQQMTCFRNYTATTVDIWSSDDTSSNAASVRIYICGMAA